MPVMRWALHLPQEPPVGWLLRVLVTHRVVLLLVLQYLVVRYLAVLVAEVLWE